MKSSSTPAEVGDNSTISSAPKACPVCGSAEGWHGVITEPGEAERHACDECGTIRLVRIVKPESDEAGDNTATSPEVAPPIPCPSWCTVDHAREVIWPVPDPSDVFEHLGTELARLPLGGESRVSVQPSLAYTRAGAEHGRTVAVECGRDLTIDEARHFAAAVLRAVVMLEATP